jgi:hypothetical protein
MAKTSPPSSHPHGADDPHAAHGSHHAEETPEQREDARRAEAVQDSMSRLLRVPGLAIALLSAFAAVVVLGGLMSPGPDIRWTWLLLLAMTFAWGLSLWCACSDDEAASAESAPPSAH